MANKPKRVVKSKGSTKNVNSNKSSINININTNSSNKKTRKKRIIKNKNVISGESTGGVNGIDNTVQGYDIPTYQRNDNYYLITELDKTNRLIKERGHKYDQLLLGDGASGGLLSGGGGQQLLLSRLNDVETKANVAIDDAKYNRGLLEDGHKKMNYYFDNAKPTLISPPIIDTHKTPIKIKPPSKRKVINTNVDVPVYSANPEIPEKEKYTMFNKYGKQFRMSVNAKGNVKTEKYNNNQKIWNSSSQLVLQRDLKMGKSSVDQIKQKLKLDAQPNIVVPTVTPSQQANDNWSRLDLDTDTSDLPNRNIAVTNSAIKESKLLSPQYNPFDHIQDDGDDKHISDESDDENDIDYYKNVTIRTPKRFDPFDHIPDVPDDEF